MANFIIGGIILLVLALAVRSVIKSRKKGGCSSCGGGCDHCSGCH